MLGCVHLILLYPQYFTWAIRSELFTFQEKEISREWIDIKSFKFVSRGGGITIDKQYDLIENN